MIRDIVHGALADAREVTGGFAREMSQALTNRTDDEMLHIYTTLFRGNPVALAQWIAKAQAQGKLPKGDPLKFMRSYEARMEALLKERGAHDAVPAYDAPRR